MPSVGRPRSGRSNLRRGTRSADPSPSRSPSPPALHLTGHHPGQYQAQYQGQGGGQYQGQGQGQSQGQGQAQGQSQYQSQVQSQGPYSKNPHLSAGYHPGAAAAGGEDLAAVHGARSEPRLHLARARLRDRRQIGGRSQLTRQVRVLAVRTLRLHLALVLALSLRLTLTL